MSRQAPTHIKATIAANLKAARLTRGLTQRAVAERIGASSDQVAKWERGDVRPGDEWQARLATFFFDGDMLALYRPVRDEEAA